MIDVPAQLERNSASTAPWEATGPGGDEADVTVVTGPAGESWPG